MLCSSRKLKFMNVDYHIGPVCPLRVTGQCEVAREHPGKIHVVSLHGEHRTLVCGKNSVHNMPSVKEWLREIVFVHVGSS